MLWELPVARTTRLGQMLEDRYLSSDSVTRWAISAGFRTTGRSRLGALPSCLWYRLLRPRKLFFIESRVFDTRHSDVFHSFEAPERHDFLHGGQYR